MKAVYLIVGILIGGAFGFWVARTIGKNDDKAVPATESSAHGSDTLAKWSWPDSLDAVKAAPQSHKIVYEDSTVRILQVTLNPNMTEPVHVHKWKSVMWFAEATPMTYYKNGLISGRLAVTDSIPIPHMPPEVLNHGEALAPEEPHAIKNMSNKKGIAYRVEFKK
ncbi:hypothetical protein [Mucilaginibacter myungsuensis]|uniref:Quercetin dioxygenase-like cupin family protein n=1 Tax=Mucilaginibacter myungsuensis TaxID=649104 RepID=A0A929KZR7_9SPHI|nr:hypothetical protein [Mucilaginibacter myungsuensis]MBE9663550.1 hypothetical protein [Mucilaginibacter myungsuensis]MDN3600288.1 hypothetical protein [Mucilaginibacter myungsuensis]